MHLHADLGRFAAMIDVGEDGEAFGFENTLQALQRLCDGTRTGNMNQAAILRFGHSCLLPFSLESRVPARRDRRTRSLHPRFRLRSTRWDADYVQKTDFQAIS